MCWVLYFAVTVIWPDSLDCCAETYTLQWQWFAMTDKKLQMEHWDPFATLPLPHTYGACGLQSTPGHSICSVGLLQQWPALTHSLNWGPFPLIQDQYLPLPAQTLAFIFVTLPFFWITLKSFITLTLFLITLNTCYFAFVSYHSEHSCYFDFVSCHFDFRFCHPGQQMHDLND